jgi:phosphoribosylformylglycinamidine (FGAM) synthase-like amidotransferase family enzyme
MGMMPHPEKASEKIIGGDDGNVIFSSMINSFVASMV